MTEIPEYKRVSKIYKWWQETSTWKMTKTKEEKNEKSVPKKKNEKKIHKLTDILKLCLGKTCKE